MCPSLDALIALGEAAVPAIVEATHLRRPGVTAALDRPAAPALQR